MAPQLTDEIKKQLKDSGKSLEVLTAPVGDDPPTIVVTPPSAQAYSAWRDAREVEGASNHTRRLADTNFVASALAWPSPEEWTAMARDQPGLPASFAGELATMAGLVKQVTRKKL